MHGEEGDAPQGLSMGICWCATMLLGEKRREEGREGGMKEWTEGIREEGKRRWKLREKEMQNCRCKGDAEL